MRFNHKLISLLAVLVMTSTGCGLLGKKALPEEASKDMGTGCLNNSKDLVSRYAHGQVNNQEWKSAFDCIGQSLDFFTEFVRGSTQDAYSQSDMYTFISKFILTNRPIQPGLLRGAFQLKAAMLGGDSSQFKKEEIETFKRILPKFRDITAELIPYLRIQQSSADYAAYLDVAEAFKRAGEQFADLINTLPVGELTQQAVTLLVEQLASSLDVPVIDGLGSKVFVAKWLLFNTRPDAIEMNDWGQLIRVGMGLGGLALVAKLAPHGDLTNDYHYREFFWELANRARPYINDAVQFHDGMIPLPLLDHLVDEIPADLFNVPAEILKQTLRPMIRKVLMSETKMGIDKKVVETFYAQGALWVKNIGLLDRLYEKMNLNPEATTPAIFKQAMIDFASTLQDANDKALFAVIQPVLLAYKPLFYKNTHSIMFGDNVDYSKFQHFFVLTISQLVAHLHQVYGSGADYFVKDDFDAIYEDYIDLLFGLKMIDRTVSGFAKKRFQDLDLFTPVSNGDDYASLQEVVYYAMMMVSGGEMTNKLKEEIVPHCQQNQGEDIMGWKWIAASCFRNEFEKRLVYWLDYFPKLKNYWNSIDDATKEKALIWLEHGSRRNGFNEDYFASYDFKAIPTILHYTESLFNRFDADKSGFLGKGELFTAFPVFKLLLANKAKISASQDYILQGVFTYIVKNRTMPDTTGVNGIAKLAWWLVIFKLPTTKVSTDRTGIFNIVCLLANTEKIPTLPDGHQQSQDQWNSTICRP